MFNVLLILIFTGGIIIAAIFAGVTFLQGVRSAQEIQITRQRLIETAARIQSQARYISGYIALPQGTTGASPYAYNQVPSWIDSHARNAAGVPFLYCPYRSTANGGTSGTVTMPSGATYNINYTNNASTISQNYVTAGDAPDSDAPSGTIGILIAAAPQSNLPPDCSSISAASDGTPIVTGGIVVPIQDNFLNKMQVPTVRSEIRIFIASAATGDGSGRDTNNYSTISNAMNLLSYAKPAQATLVFTSGTFSITDSLSWGGRVLLLGTSTAATTINVSNQTIDEFSLLAVSNALLTDSGTLTVKGDLQLDAGNVTAGTLAVIGGTLSAYGTTITGDITIDGGGTFANSTNSTTVTAASNRGIKIINGFVTGDIGVINLNSSTANIVPVYVGAGGILHSSDFIYLNSPATLSLKGGMVVDPGGHVMLDRNTAGLIFYRLNDYAFYLHGNLVLGAGGVLQTSSLDGSGLDYGIVMASGASLLTSQANSRIMIGAASSSDKPDFGLYDNGGSHFHYNSMASSTTIQAKTECWKGRSGTNLFSDSPTGSNGNLSYTNNSAGMRWLRLYNQSFAVCSTL